MILSKGCNSIILGSLNSDPKSQLRVLKLRQSKDLGWPAFNKCCYCDCESFCDCYENTGFIKALLSSCSSLRHLVIEDVFLSQNMAESICKNGKTLQILNLNRSDLDIEGDLNDYWQEIIKCCQELKEYVNCGEGLMDEDIEFLVKNIPPNVEKLDLSSCPQVWPAFNDYHVEILLRRCNKIKALSLEATVITDLSLKNIRQYLNHTLEELSLGPNDGQAVSRHLGQDNYYDMIVILPSLFGLKSMQRLKILNLCYIKDDSEEIQNLRQQLPHLMIKGVLN